MPERIPVTAWFLPQESAECSVFREAQAALTREGLAAAAAMVALLSLTEPDLRVGPDHERLDQVLRQLLENGPKYTGATGGVAGVDEKRGHRALLCVRDNGQGNPGEGSSFFVELSLWTEAG